jgi:hypothetical protein
MKLEVNIFLPFITTGMEIQVYQCDPNQETIQRMAPRHHSKRSSEESLLEVKFDMSALL